MVVSDLATDSHGIYTCSWNSVHISEVLHICVLL